VVAVGEVVVMVMVVVVGQRWGAEDGGGAEGGGRRGGGGVEVEAELVGGHQDEVETTLGELGGVGG